MFCIDVITFRGRGSRANGSGGGNCAIDSNSNCGVSIPIQSATWVLSPCWVYWFLMSSFFVLSISLPLSRNDSHHKHKHTPSSKTKWIKCAHWRKKIPFTKQRDSAWFLIINVRAKRKQGVEKGRVQKKALWVLIHISCIHKDRFYVVEYRKTNGLTILEL